MPVVKYAVSNLSQGASQQAESQRFPSQATEQINAFSSHIKGLTKRTPTEHLAKVAKYTASASSPAANTFVHLTSRDREEQYAIIINKGGAAITTTGVDVSSTLGGIVGSALVYQNDPTTENDALFTVNQPVQIFHSPQYNTPKPAGLDIGTTYYVHSEGAQGTVGDNHWRFIRLKTTTANSVNSPHPVAGGYITLGEVELTSQALGTATGDEYKAGLLVESVRRTDGSWIDGVITVRFGSILSTSGHSYQKNDTVRLRGFNTRGHIEGVTIPKFAEYVLHADEDLLLTQPAKTIAGTSLRANELANKFWLKRVTSLGRDSEGNVIDIGGVPDGDGYRVDGDQLWRYNSYRTRFSQGESVDDIIGWDYATGDESTPVATKVKIIQEGGKWKVERTLSNLDFSTGHDDSGSSGIAHPKFEAGQLIKLGKHVNGPRCIITNVTATKLTLAEQPDTAGSTPDSESPDEYFLYFWCTLDNQPTVRTEPKPRYFREWDYRPVQNIGGVATSDTTAAVKVGYGTDTSRVEIIKEGVGPYVYDLKTGEEYPIVVNEEFGNPYDYLSVTGDPKKDLTAQTIGDSTFIVNKNIQVDEGSWTPNIPKYEAFITVRQADYGKYYRINIGDEAVNHTLNPNSTDNVENEESGVVAASSYALLYGADPSGISNNTASRPIIKIRRIEKGDFNRWSIRATQNFRFNWGYYSTLSFDDGKWPPLSVADVVTLPPNGRAKAWEKLSYKEEAAFSKWTITDKWGKAVGSTDDASNKIALLYDSTAGREEITIFANYYWAKSFNSTLVNTTAEEIVEAINNAPWSDKFEAFLCDDQGRAVGDAGFTQSTEADPDYVLTDVILGNELIDQDGDKVGDTFKVGGTTHAVGRDFAARRIGLFDPGSPWGGAFDVRQGFAYEYKVPGLLCPKTPKNRVKRGHKYHKFTGGAGTPPKHTVGGVLTGDEENTNKIQIYDGQYYYKTPRWTGNDKQDAVGTHRIAEFLASNGLIITGEYKVTPDKRLQGAGGKSISHYSTKEVRNEADEELLGLTHTRSSLSDTTATGDHGYSAAKKHYVAGWKGGVIGDFKDRDGDPLSWNVDQFGSTISISNPEGSFFRIAVEDDLGNEGLNLTYYEVSEQAKLPEICRHGHVVRVIGNEREDADDYYLKFEGDDKDPHVLQHGRWIETVGFNVTAELNHSTMPVVMQRRFKEDGSKYFTLGHQKWGDRQAGDDYTNPVPSLVGSTISDIFVYKNRLGFLSGSNVVMSQSGEYYNLFRATVAAFQDTAPIDVRVSSTKVASLHYAIPYAERLVLFSDQGQFALQGDQYLSPKTVAITPTTNFSNFSVKTAPVLTGNSVFYPFDRTGFSGVGEYYLSKDQLDSLDAKDITAHLPKYIQGKVVKMTCCSSEDVLAVLTDTTGGANLYIYKYYLADNGQKVQSAWFTYKTGDSNAQFLDIEFIGNILYTVIKRGSLVFFESMTIEDDLSDTGKDFQVLLDRRIKMASGDSRVVYASGNTTITLPYAPTTAFTVMPPTNVPVNPTTVTTSTAVFNGVDLTGKELIMGEPYTMEYTLSKPYLRKAQSEGKGPLYGGRHQLFRGELEFANARSFDVDVTHLPQNVTQSSTHTFGGVDLGYATAVEGSSTLSSGFYKFGIMGKNDRVNIKISNDTPYPSDFLSIDYEGRAYSRATRWG